MPAPADGVQHVPFFPVGSAFVADNPVLEALLYGGPPGASG